jgi:hypothetical protein
MRNVSDKSCTENQNAHFHLVTSTSFVLENRAIYEIMWKNVAGSDKPHMTM